MRKALVVGIDFYRNIVSLHGCVNDARSVAAVLARHGDEQALKNFEVTSLLSTGSATAVTRGQLKSAIERLFADDSEIALLYFAGHGYIDKSGGYLCCADSTAGDDGLPLSLVMALASRSRALNKVVVLDSCHSGVAGTHALHDGWSELSEEITILCASTPEQYATEENGSGVFTNLFVDALQGAAANLVGEITPGAIYAHIDQSLGGWAEQRPMFKTNVKRFVSLRRVHPPLLVSELRRITEFFSAPGCEFPLDPSFEPERCGNGDAHLPPPVPRNTSRFAILQKFNRVNLVVPVDAPHMWHAAMQSKSCRLTLLGEHYRRLVDAGRV